MSEQDQAVITEQQVPVETAETPVTTPSGETAKPEVAEVKPVGEVQFTPEQQARVNQLIQERLARDRAKRERELEAEVRRLGQQQQPPKVEQQASDPAAPKRDDFEDYQEYLRADARFVALQAVKADREAQEQAAKQAKEKEAQTTVLQEFDKRREAAVTKYPDFEDVVAVAQTLPISDAAFAAITNLEEGWDLIHYLGTNPAEAHRIYALPPARQAAEVGKLAAKVASAPAPKPASVSRAPAPIEPLAGGVTQVSDKAPDDPDEYKRWHDERERQKRKRT